MISETRIRKLLAEQIRTIQNEPKGSDGYVFACGMRHAYVEALGETLRHFEYFPESAEARANLAKYPTTQDYLDTLEHYELVA